MPLGEHRCLSSFLDSNMKKLWLKTDSVKVIPPLAAPDENVQKAHKIINKD
jgi:hypothetical protein